MTTRRQLFKQVRDHAWAVRCRVSGPEGLRKLDDDELEGLVEALREAHQLLTTEHADSPDKGSCPR